MKKKKNIFLFVITLALCVVLFCVNLTGLAVHMVAGCMLLSVVVKHVCKNMLKLQYMPKRIKVVDWVLLISIIALFVTGVLAHIWHGVIVMKVLHPLCGIVFVIGILIHAMQHKAKGKGVVKDVS